MSGGDAPQAVEQCDREAAAAFSETVVGRTNGRDQIAECRAGKQDDSFLVQAFARHRLAALASAPAGDGYGKWHRMLLDLVDAIHRDRGEKTQAIGIDLSYQQALAAALARPRAAVDRETILKLVAETLADYRAFLDGMTPMQHAEVAWEAGHKWPDDDDFEHAGRVLQVLDALPDLIRPRAAVGEQSREAIARAAADGCDDEYPDGRRVRDGEKWWCAYDGAMRALALQSPPAKVEGRG